MTANSNKRIVETHINIQKTNFKIQSNRYTEDFLKMNVVINEISWYKYTDEVIPGLRNCNFNFIERLQADNFSHYQFKNELELRNWNSEIPVFLLLGKHDQIVGFKEQAEMAMNFKNCNCLLYTSPSPRDCS